MKFYNYEKVLEVGCRYGLVCVCVCGDVVKDRIAQHDDDATHITFMVSMMVEQVMMVRGVS